MFFGSVVVSCLARASRLPRAFSRGGAGPHSRTVFSRHQTMGGRVFVVAASLDAVCSCIRLCPVCARPPSFLCLVCKGTTKETKRQSETRNYFALNFVKTTRPPHPAAPSALILKSLWLAEKTGSVPVVRGMLPVVCAMLPVAPPRQPTTSEKRMPSAPAIWRKVDSCMSVCPCSRAEI